MDEQMGSNGICQLNGTTWPLYMTAVNYKFIHDDVTQHHAPHVTQVTSDDAPAL